MERNFITEEMSYQEKIQRREKEIEVITGTGEVLIDKSASGKIRDWDGKKAMNLELVGILKALQIHHPSLISNSRLNQIESCANYLKYGVTTEGRKKLVDANFCRFKFCPICVWRKSLKMFSQISAVTERLNEEYPSGRYIFVTLTIKNPSAQELAFTIDRLNEGFKNLVQKCNTVGGDIRIFKDSLLGYLKCLEITYNADSKTYHPHIHAVFHLKGSYFGRNYLNHSRWTEMWKSLLKLDYEPMVDVRAIKKTTPKLIAEVAKYPVKVTDLLKIKDSSEQVGVLATLLTTTHHRRFVTFGGTFRKIKRELALDDIETGSLVHVESENAQLNYVAYELYKYHLQVGCYIC